MKVPSPATFGGGGGEAKAGRRQAVEAGEVLDDRDARAEQARVHGPLAACAVPSMFRLSMPTSAAPWSTSQSAAAAVR